MDINQILQQDFVTYAANLRRLTQSEQQVVLVVLNQLQHELVEMLQQNDLSVYKAGKIRSLLKQINETINNSYSELNALITADMEELARITTRSISGSFTGVGITLQSVALSDEQYKALATNALIEGAPSAKWWKKQSADLQFKFANEIRKGVIAGESIDDIVRRIRGTATRRWWQYEWKGKTYRYYEFTGGIMNIATRQAQALVRTSVQQVAGDTRKMILQANGDLLKGVHWVSTLDSRTTFMCFPGSELVSTIVPIEKLFRVYYEGEVIVVTTAAGKQFVGTPNHPILTAHGWLPLNKLQPYKHIVYSMSNDFLSLLKKENISMEATFAELFNSISNATTFESKSIDRSPVDFYGDGKSCKGEINIKIANDFLRNGYDIIGFEKFKNILFRFIHNPVLFFRDPFFRFLFRRWLPTSSSFSGNSSIGKDFVNKSNATAGSANNIRKSDPVFIEGKNMFLIPDISGGFLPSGDIFHDTGSNEQAGNGGSRDSMIPCNLGGGYPGFIQPDYIVSVRSDFRSEHVYTLQNYLGFYTISGIIVKNCAARDGKLYTLDGKPIGHNLPFEGGPPIHWNCRSTLVPVTKSWKELSGSDQFDKWDKLVANSARASMDGQIPASQSFDDWFAGKSDKFQKDYLGPGRYKMYKEGRIKIENLIGADGEPLTLEELHELYG